jgi:hypothetical protein
MYPLTVIHDPDVLRDRSALISLTACHNSHVPHDPNALIRRSSAARTSARINLAAADSSRPIESP